MAKDIDRADTFVQVRHSRRQLITGLSLVGAGTLIAGCRRVNKSSTATNSEQTREDEVPEGAKDEADVTATEDLMREHGILRRALLVYREAASKLRENSASVLPEELEKVAQLVRAFGEDYHEKKLEEAFVFPALKKSPGPATQYIDILIAQHVRGREITDYILAATAADKFGSGVVRDFTAALEGFIRMYEHHAAIEDTIIFPAWKAALKEGELDEMGARFEEIEEEQFGADGFEAALKRMGDIEQSLGMASLEMFTAPSPPAVRGGTK
jgi:hemerythrin-like domain-containing protein